MPPAVEEIAIAHDIPGRGDGGFDDVAYLGAEQAARAGPGSTTAASSGSLGDAVPPLIEEPMSSAEVDAYIAALPEDRRGPMQQLRETILAAAPEATEVITYKMPGVKLGNRFLVSYDAFKRHYSLFPSTDPMIAALGDELAPYLRGKGTISFPADQPLPLDLISRIVENRVTERGSAADDRA